MQPPVFAERLGNGQWLGITYVLDICPICASKKTMMFTGQGMWGCKKCKKGGKDIASFREYCKTNPMLSEYVPYIVSPEPPEEVVVVSAYDDPYQEKAIGTGFGALDFMIGGLQEGALTVVTGKRGEGKSTILSQLALNGVNNGHVVYFYSGELSAGRFQQWIFSQAAGAKYIESKNDQFGAQRYIVNKQAEEYIRKWLANKLVLYDNTKVKSSERGTIMKSMTRSRQYYGCDLFIVDNLMTAQYDIDSDKDSLRAQANFASEMLNFARENNVHVILVAHPRKGEADDINESVAGLGEITNLATNVMQIRKTSDKERMAHSCDCIVTVSKNRTYGDTGTVRFNFDKKSRRFIPLDGTCIGAYDWVKYVKE